VTDDLTEVFNVEGYLSSRLGSAEPLPNTPGGYVLQHTRTYLATFDERGWALDGKKISAEGLRRLMETYKLSLVPITREEE